jgi:hypothetical protein
LKELKAKSIGDAVGMAVYTTSTKTKMIRFFGKYRPNRLTVRTEEDEEGPILFTFIQFAPSFRWPLKAFWDSRLF